MTIFDCIEVPVACSMINASQKCGGDPLHSYICYWIAFNNIYVTITDKALDQNGKQRVTMQIDKADGTIKRQRKAGVDVPKTDTLSEGKQIEYARKEFSPQLIHELICHPSMQFFVDRTPKWRGNPIAQDVLGQTLNGVLNVGYTSASANPVWSPIDKAAYRQYIENCRNGRSGDESLQKQLSEEVVALLYTVRNNTFHGGKRNDDSNDLEVLRNALSLLSMIVNRFIRSPEQVEDED